MTRMERRKLREQEHKFRFIKINKRLVSVGLTTLIGIGIIGLSEGVEASASEWRPTTLEEMKTRVKLEDGKYTFQSGDTFWAIGNAINIKPEKLMELNNFAPGTQYSVPIGTTIYWSGDNVKVVDQNGNVIAQETIQSADKVNPNLPVGGNNSNTANQSNSENVKGNSSSTNSNNNGSNTSNGTNSNVKGEENKGSNVGNGSNGGGTPSTPTPKPTDPTNPVEPEKPTPPTQSELKKLRARLAELKAQLAQAKQELAQAEQELANAKSDTSKSDLEAKINEQQTIIDSAQATITTKQTEIASIDSQIVVANTELSTAQSNLNSANTALSTAQSNTAAAQQAFDEANTALLADPSDPILQQAVTDTQSALNNAQAKETLAVNEQASAQTAVNTAQSTIDSLNSSKQQANSELETAQNTFTTAQTEKSNLEQQLANIGNNNIADLEAKVAEKKKIVEDLEAEIKKVEEQISKLEGTEKPQPPVITVDKSGLENLVNSVKATDTSKYTDDTVSAFTNALANANSILGNKDATQEQVNSAVSSLQSAFNNLVEKPVEEKVDKTALETLVNNVKGTNVDKFTTETAQAFTKALTNAQSVLDNKDATQSQVDAVVSSLQTAFDNLVEKPEEVKVDKSALETLINKVKNTDTTKFTEETAKAFSQTLTNVQAVLGNKDATQAQVDQATSSLQSAFDNLKEKPEEIKVDKSALQSAVDSVSSLKQADYTTASWTKLQTALTNAKQVLGNKDATQSQVDAQVTALNNAKSALVKKANKTALDQAIAKAPAQQGSYTDASWKALQSALSEAKKVSGKEDATQSEVDTATTALNKAINDLKVQKYTLTVIHKDSDGKVLDTEEFQVEKGKNYSAKSKGFEGYELVGEGTKTITNIQENGTVIFTYKKQKGEEEAIKETQDKVNSGVIDQWNDYRGDNGKTQAYENETLQKAADLRAKEIATLFDHTRPNGLELNGYNSKTGEWGDSLAEEVDYYKTEGMGVKRNILAENIAKIEGVSLEWIEEYGSTWVMESWKASPSHNRNLLLNDSTIPVNQFSLGSYIEKNSDGTYNVYYVALVGYDYNLK